MEDVSGSTGVYTKHSADAVAAAAASRKATADLRSWGQHVLTSSSSTLLSSRSSFVWEPNGVAVGLVVCSPRDHHNGSCSSLYLYPTPDPAAAR